MRTIEKLCRRTSGLLAVPILVGGGLLFVPQAASAQGTCIQDVWTAHGNNQNLTCTANDVTLSSASNVNIITGGICDASGCKCFAGQTFTFTAVFSMTLTTQTRYDVGFYIATDTDSNNDGALTGQCTATVSTTNNTSNFVQLDGTPDACGEIDSAHNPLKVTSNEITMTCPAAGEQVVVPFCTTWRQPGSNELCQVTNDAFPGSPSKCNCGDLPIPIFSAPVEFTPTKTAVTTEVDESGGAATYTVAVHNDSTVAALNLTSLTDDKYGDITTVHAAGGGFFAVTSTDCAVPQNIAPSGTYTCTFVGTVPPGNSGGRFTDVVTACGSNIANPNPVCKTDDAFVLYRDVPQAPTLVKAATACVNSQVDVSYTVVVTNNPGNDTSPSNLVLNSLIDNVYGNITQVQGRVISTGCAVPQTIAPLGNYTCSFVGRISINGCETTEVDEVRATATDAEGKFYDPTTTPPLSPDTATVIVKVTPQP
jgi:hypothetical protein